MDGETGTGRTRGEVAADDRGGNAPPSGGGVYEPRAADPGGTVDLALGGTPALIASYAQYRDAQRAVDSLSDAGFPVRAVTLVWQNLRRIEHVTGRRTVWSAAGQGAISGAWFGGILGLLLSLFVELDEDTTAFGLVVIYLLVGAVVGAIWLGVLHALRRGTRDFDTIDQLDAERYDLYVMPEHAHEAARHLGLDLR